MDNEDFLNVPWAERGLARPGNVQHSEEDLRNLIRLKAENIDFDTIRIKHDTALTYQRMIRTAYPMLPYFPLGTVQWFENQYSRSTVKKLKEAILYFMDGELYVYASAVRRRLESVEVQRRLIRDPEMQPEPRRTGQLTMNQKKQVLALAYNHIHDLRASSDKFTDYLGVIVGLITGHRAIDIARVLTAATSRCNWSGATIMETWLFKRHGHPVKHEIIIAGAPRAALNQRIPDNLEHLRRLLHERTLCRKQFLFVNATGETKRRIDAICKYARDRWTRLINLLCQSLPRPINEKFGFKVCRGAFLQQSTSVGNLQRRVTSLGISDRTAAKYYNRFTTDHAFEIQHDLQENWEEDYPDRPPAYTLRESSDNEEGGINNDMEEGEESPDTSQPTSESQVTTDSEDFIIGRYL